MRNVTVALFGVLVLMVGGILLQIFLSKRECRWPGLVLPLLSFLYSLVMVLSVTAYDGGISWGPILASLILGNIPTVILLTIYAACREAQRKKRKKAGELNRTRIDDI